MPVSESTVRASSCSNCNVADRDMGRVGRRGVSDRRRHTRFRNRLMENSLVSCCNWVDPGELLSNSPPLVQGTHEPLYGSSTGDSTSLLREPSRRLVAASI